MFGLPGSNAYVTINWIVFGDPKNEFVIPDYQIKKK